MKESTALQIEAMKKQSFGIEIEGNNITREKAAKTAAEYFGTGRYEYTARRNGYDSWSAWDAQGREWKFQKDVSIAGPDSQKCEAVSPILYYDDLAGTDSGIAKGWNAVGLRKGMRSACSHWRGRTHPADHPQPCEHHGSPRGAACQSHQDRPLPHEPVLPDGQP